MNHLRNIMRREAARAMGSRAVLRLGTVSSYDPNTYAAKVELQPDGEITGWLPIAAIGVGNGWGVQIGPQIGDSCIVDFQEASNEAGIVMLRHFGAKNRPLSVPPGEIWATHQSGSYLRFITAGDVELVTSRDLVATVGRNLSATVTGNVTATIGGALTATVTGTAAIYAAAVKLGKQAADSLQALMMAAAWTWLKTHTHAGVQTGSGNTGAPNSVPADSSALTSIVSGE